MGLHERVPGDRDESERAHEQWQVDPAQLIHGPACLPRMGHLRRAIWLPKNSDHRALSRWRLSDDDPARILPNFLPKS